MRLHNWYAYAHLCEGPPSINRLMNRSMGTWRFLPIIIIAGVSPVVS